jgi:hypothetical protein
MVEPPGNDLLEDSFGCSPVVGSIVGGDMKIGYVNNLKQLLLPLAFSLLPFDFSYPQRDCQLPAYVTIAGLIDNESNIICLLG